MIPYLVLWLVISEYVSDIVFGNLFFINHLRTSVLYICVCIYYVYIFCLSETLFCSLSRSSRNLEWPQSNARCWYFLSHPVDSNLGSSLHKGLLFLLVHSLSLGIHALLLANSVVAEKEPPRDAQVLIPWTWKYVVLYDKGKLKLLMGLNWLISCPWGGDSIANYPKLLRQAPHNHRSL